MWRRYRTEQKTLSQLITEASMSKGAIYYANKNTGGKNRSRNCPIKYPKEKEMNLKKLELKKIH